MQPGTASPDVAHQPAGRTLGGYLLGARIRSTAIAEVFRAERDGQAATVHVVHPALAAHPDVVRAVVAQAPRAAAITGLRNLGATLGAGDDGGALYVITEAEDGPTLREVLARKYASAGAGLPPRGAGNVVAQVAEALRASGLVHGALTSESITIARAGRVAIVDLALGPALAAAIAAGLVPASGALAPELAHADDAPTAAADVYGVGAVLYDAIVGRPLARGGARPSEAAPGVAPEVDELVARACAERPERRFASVAALRELVVDILMTVDEEADEPEAATAIAIPPALEAAMAEPHECWLVSKGRFDFGPFTMKQIVDQILHGQIHHGHVLMDKDNGGRAKVDEHPLLGPLVDAAKQARDDARRAHAEVKQQASERKRGAALYGVIGAGVLAAVAAAWFLVTTLTSATKRDVAGVASVAEASLDVKVSAPKAPAKKSGGGGGARRSSGGGGGGGGGGDENLALDMSDDSDGGSEQLDMDTVYGVYARYGGPLGRCLSKTGSSSANISIIIDGPSGKVTWVRVNGESGGALHGCLSGVLRSMKFPSVDGPRTRAEFEIGL